MNHNFLLDINRYRKFRFLIFGDKLSIKNANLSGCFAFLFFCKSIFYNYLEPLNLNAIKNTAWFD